MSNTNSIGGVVKILEIPKQKTLSGNISFTKFRAQFPQVRQNCLVHLIFWGNLAHDVARYYKINDYILIEGSLSLKDKPTISSSGRVLKKLEITVFKVYPFLLSFDRSVNSISTY